MVIGRQIVGVGTVPKSVHCLFSTSDTPFVTRNILQIGKNVAQVRNVWIMCYAHVVIMQNHGKYH